MILWLFENLIGWPWCWHRWETERTADLWEDEGAQFPIGRIIYLRCEKCGDWKRRRLT